MVKAVIFDLDNTLMDFMTMKKNAINAAVKAMIDAGLNIDPQKAYDELYAIYDRGGIEFQKVFNNFLEDCLGYVDWKILSSGVVAYRKAREASLVLYPHVNMTLTELLKNIVSSPKKNITPKKIIQGVKKTNQLRYSSYSSCLR